MRSDTMKRGIHRISTRALLKGAGYRQGDIDRPFIGVINAYSPAFPGHMGMDKLTRAVEEGIWRAGGTPLACTTIGVCDGYCAGHEGMRWSLPSRELIADSIETMAQAHRLDGLVLVTGCDKITPGMLMAAPWAAGGGGPGPGRPGADPGEGGQGGAAGNRPAGHRGGGLSRLRQLCRDVHRQLHGLPYRGPGDGSAGERDDTGGPLRAAPPG